MACVVVASTVGACDRPLTSVQRELEAAGVSPMAYTLVAADEAVALERRGSSLALTHIVAGDDGWEVERCTGSGSEFTSIAGYFCGAEGPLVHHWNAFLYGMAADPVAQVVLEDLEVSGGDVRDGLWLVAISATNLPLGAVQWAGLSSDGGVIASGSGVPGA